MPYTMLLPVLANHFLKGPPAYCIAYPCITYINAVIVQITHVISSIFTVWFFSWITGLAFRQNVLDKLPPYDINNPEIAFKYFGWFVVGLLPLAAMAIFAAVAIALMGKVVEGLGVVRVRCRASWATAAGRDEERNGGGTELEVRGR